MSYQLGSVQFPAVISQYQAALFDTATLGPVTPAIDFWVMSDGSNPTS